ncbi:MAG TPA: hypothetical protein VKQ30_09965 [Ktedonobacterales bacterium]|nr:hypothetical protein [Ktedonobacterales bacterium]
MFRRLTLVVTDGIIEHVIYPVLPPDEHVGQVLARLREHRERYFWRSAPARLRAKGRVGPGRRPSAMAVTPVGVQGQRRWRLLVSVERAQPSNLVRPTGMPVHANKNVRATCSNQCQHQSDTDESP